MNSKKSFIFTLFSFFISVLILTIGVYYSDLNSYENDNSFKEARITNLQNEINYFGNFYFIRAVEFSTFNFLNYISKNKIILDEVKNNHTKLNQILQEAILNGTHNKNKIGFMQDKTIHNLTEDYIKNTLQNKQLNLSFELENIKIEETKPYVVDLNFDIKYNFTTTDNIVVWNKTLNNKVKINLNKITLPTHFYYSNLDIKLNPIETNQNNTQYDLELLNLTLKENLAYVFLEDKFRQTIGLSFLKRLINSDFKSNYKKVFFHNFDLDFQNSKTTFLQRFNKTQIKNSSIINYKNDNEKFQTSLLLKDDDVINFSLENNLSADFTLFFSFKNLDNSNKIIFKNKDINIGYNNQTEKLVLNEIRPNSLDFKKNNWNQISIKKENSEIFFFVNENFLQINKGINGFQTFDFSNSNNKNSRFLIDEIHIYDYPISNQNILNANLNPFSYLNGCCNYINLINPNSMNFNKNSFKKNSSYSSSLFFDYHNNSKKPDLLLFKIDNITSDDTSKNYYNLLFDICLIDAFRVSKYSNLSNTIVNGGDEKYNTCEKLIENGIY